MVHTRATNSAPLVFDPEPERTFLQRLRENIQDIVINSAMADRTLRQLTDPDLTQQHLGVTLPALGDGVSFELKTGFINLLPKFHGHSGEDPIMHLSEFHDIC